jgi:hypothetical protein
MAPKKTLITSFDALKNYSADEYFSCGETKIVEGAAGHYREAEPKPLARFGYRFAIQNIGRPHLAVIRYPDDKRRFMIINDGTTYDLSTGITTGHAYPISGEMKELHQIFWPRWRDCSLCFMTWGHNEPAAVEGIEIYELDELPATNIPNKHGFRELGIQYEDPCGTGLAEGATTFEQWLGHVIDYAKHTGQTLLAYPICWYHGPWYPSKSERADTFSVVAASDRKLYVAWTDEPEDWPAILLERFEKEGLSFQGALTLLRLSSLMKKMNIDLPSIQAGAETINNMLWCDEVQSGTRDWTTVYNTLNFPKMLDRTDPLACNTPMEWAYGEKTDQPYHYGPIFNPLHPVVQEATIGFIREIAERYGKFKSFKGISINFWGPAITWFGSLHSGYDDYTISLFENETGIKIPVEPKDPNRFSKRYDFLIFKFRPEWIAWRCRKIHGLIRIFRDAIVEVRPDLRLTLSLWCEPFIPGIYGNGGPEHQIHARISTLDIFKNGGLDPQLYRNEPNIEIDFQLDGGGRDRGWSMDPNAKLEAFFMFRDHDFLDETILQSMASLPKSGAFIFNDWHEAWGNHKWFPCEPDDKNVPAISSVYGKRDGVHTFRMNSEYPPDGFWWDSQLRITAAYPPAPHFMEQYAHALAEFDACRITRGGLFLDKAHSEEIERFARVYRTLPADKFETVGVSTDPVAVRTLVKDNVHYLYLINREYYPINVELKIDRPGVSAIDLASQQIISSEPSVKLTLGAYELKAFSLPVDAKIENFTVQPPIAVVQKLTANAQTALKKIRQVQTKGFFITGLDKIVADIESALKQYHWSRLRHLLTSYPVFKCNELLSTQNN